MSRHGCLFPSFSLGALTPFLASGATPATASVVEHIQPILAENCFHSHGPDAGARKGKLRLDLAEEATMPRWEREAPIVPGIPKASLLVERILSSDEEEPMPPPEAHKQRKLAKIALIERWIEEGAKYQGHWAYLKPERASLPDTPNKSWARNPINARY